MATTWYLDWVPYSVNAAVFDFKEGALPAGMLDGEMGRLISSVDYFCRSDGIVAFRITWLSDPPEDPVRRIGIAHDVSRNLKTHLGHHHVFNGGKNRAPRHPFPSITVNPIEIEDKIELVNSDGQPETISIDTNSIKGLASSDDFLLSLKATNLFNTRRDDRTAVFLIRKQYSRTIERALAIRQLIRGKNIKLGPFTIQRYGWRAPVIFIFLMTIITAIVKAFNLISPEKIPCKPKDKLCAGIAVHMSNIDKFLNEMSAIIPYAILGIVLSVFILTVSIRRRKILRALSRAKSYLKYGNIYSSILENIKGNKILFYRKVTNYSNMISVVDDIIELERKKRKQTYYYLVFISLFCVPHVLADIDNKFPYLQKSVAFLHQIVSVLK